MNLYNNLPAYVNSNFMQLYALPPSSREFNTAHQLPDVYNSHLFPRFSTIHSATTRIPYFYIYIIYTTYTYSCVCLYTYIIVLLYNIHMCIHNEPFCPLPPILVFFPSPLFNPRKCIVSFHGELDAR